MIRRIEQLLKRSEDGKEKKKTENSFTISKVTEYIQEHYAETDLSIARIADSVYLTRRICQRFSKSRRAHHRTVSAGNPCGACQTENERSAAEVLSDLRAGWVCGCQLFCKNFQKDDRHDTNRI